MKTEPPRFSERTNVDRRPNRLARIVAAARGDGTVLLDLTESNPTRCGLQAPAELLATLASPAVARYAPSAFGTVAARRAIASVYQRRGLSAQPDHLLLTSSSSEAYSWLFKLLADQGDQILVPQPSYPLLPLLGRWEGVELVPYRLMREEAWRVDLAAVERALGPKARAIVLVHPNNPTGSLVRRDDAEAISRLARAHGVALIVDEVFGDYLHGPLGADRLPSFAGHDQGLCFVLNGLSKLALLPQLKLGWISCYGPAAALAEALERLALLADSYLSVSTAAQLALPAVLDCASTLQAPLRERLRTNVSSLDEAIAAEGATCPVRRLPIEAGWYAMVEVPRTRTDDQWIDHLVRQERIIVHPGYFFDCLESGTMVLSLLLEVDRFREAIGRAVACWSAA